MSILITGGNGYSAKEISNNLLNEYIIYSPNRIELNILHLDQIQQYIDQHNIQIVIHTAICGGSRLRLDTSDDFYNNMKMFTNIVKACENNHVKLLINISSGASFSRQNNIENINENELGKNIPNDFYGFSKYLIDNMIIKHSHEILKIVNLRIFGLFSINELSTRFIKSTITNCLNNDTIHIFNDMYFDFIHIHDFVTIIKFVIKNFKTLPHFDINCVYYQKYKLSEIAKIIITKMNSKSEINIHETNNKNYSGSCERLYSLKLQLQGLEKALDEYIQLFV